MIQVFGTLKCKETQKAIRFLKERRLDFQFINLQIKGMSAGELKKVSLFIPIEELIDVNSKEFLRLNLKYMRFDITEKLLEFPLLFKTPVIRTSKKAYLGFLPDTMKEFIEKEK